MEPWDSFPDYALYGGVRYESHGDRMRKTIGAMNLDWGLPKTPAEPTLSADTGGGMDAGTYKVFCVGRTMTGRKTMPYSSTPQSITVEDSGEINVSNIPVFSSPEIKYVTFYRTTVDAEAPFFYCGSVKNGTATLTLNGSDSSLETGDFLEPPDQLADDDTAMAGPFRYQKPPIKKRCFSWDGRVWAYGEKEIIPGTVTPTHGSDIFECSGGLTSAFVGKSLVIDGEDVGYNIAKVISATRLQADQPYQRPHWRDADPTDAPFKIVGNPFRLHYSEAGEPDYFPWTNALDVGREDGGTLQAHAVHMNDALLFTESDIFAVIRTGITEAPYESHKTLSNYGCTAPRSVVSMSGAVYFYSGEHFCRYAGNDAEPIDQDLGPDKLAEINASMSKHIKVAFLGDLVLWAVPVGNVEYLNQIWVFNTRFGWWDFPWTGMRVIDMETIYTYDGLQRLWIETIAGDGVVLQEMDEDWLNDGLGNADYSGAVASATSDTLTMATASLPYGAAIGAVGARVEVIEGTGIGQVRYVADVTSANTLQVETPWATIPDNTSIVTIGAISDNLVSGHQTGGRPHDEKMFLHAEFGFEGAENG